MSETKRKGAKSIKDIPSEILMQLQNGEIETANLVEWLAIDAKILLQNVLVQLGREAYSEAILSSVHALKKQTVTTINEAIGVGLFAQAKKNNASELFSILSKHVSDSVRCWATFMVGKNSDLNLEIMLEAIQPFAADTHFGVREIAWMSVRPMIAKQLEQSISIFAVWTQHEDENVRRFASEATRPRGVWCEHIEILKQNPALALPILSPLRNDAAKYVQDSVGNWLNDASKTQPDFVRQLCAKWAAEHKSKATDYIVKKALRTLEGKK